MDLFYQAVSSSCDCWFNVCVCDPLIVVKFCVNKPFIEWELEYLSISSGLEEFVIVSWLRLYDISEE